VFWGSKDPNWAEKKNNTLLLMEEIQHTTSPGMFKNPANNGINYLSTGAGFLPSTVVFFLTGLFIYHTSLQRK